MSASGQKRLLLKILGELESRNIEEYRRSTADIQKHNFIVTRRGIRKGIRLYLIKNFSDRSTSYFLTPQNITTALNAVDRQVKKLIKNAGTEIQRLQNTKNGKFYKLIAFTEAKVMATFEEKGSSRFDKIYQIYSKDLKEIGTALAAHLSEKFGAEVDGIRGGNIAQLSHKEFEGIIESAVSDAIETALYEEESISETAFRSFLKSRGVDLRVIRKSATNEMTVGLFATVDNQEDNKESKARLAKLRKELALAIQELEEREQAFSTMEGSDSFQSKHRKKLVKNATEPFKKIKGVTVITEETSIRESSGVKKQSKRPKSTTTKYRKGLRNKGIRAGLNLKGQSAAAKPLQLIGLINKELPKTVEKNMGRPRLANRTGRFASSVRVTEVATTAKGFPSFGYTYQKNPYQTFEPGFKQGSPDFDPRPLIDSSIREIAIKFAIGRFYTRRV